MATLASQRLLAVIEVQNAIAAANLTADEVMVIVVDRVRGALDASAARVALVEGDELVCRAATERRAIGARQPRAGSFAGACVSERATLRADDVTREPRVDAATRERIGRGALACVPLLYGESAVGAIEVAASRALSDDDVEVMRLFGQVVAIALHRAYTYPRPRLDNTTDPITGLGNKRAYDERLAAELTRNARYGHSFSLAMLDLNGIEAAIDRQGQAAGDEAVREIANILRSNTRVIDGVFRVAADDFALVMPGTSLEGARVVAERCRAHIHDARLLDGAIVSSCGIVEAGNETIDELAGRVVAAVAADKRG